MQGAFLSHSVHKFIFATKNSCKYNGENDIIKLTKEAKWVQGKS